MSVHLRSLIVHILELWESASIVKKNMSKVKDNNGAHLSFSTRSSQSSSQLSVHTPADCVRAICQDREFFHVLGGHLGAMDPEELACVVAEAAEL